MRITVVHNEDAGHADIDEARLARWIARAGHTARFCTVGDAGAFDPALCDVGDLVVVAGGDGSVRAVGQTLLGRDVPMTILPVGTANNVARHLGIPRDDVEQLVHRWTDAPRAAFDVGRVRTPWGDHVFLEACGFGALARTMAVLTPIEASPSEDGTPHDELNRDIEVTREMLSDHPFHTCRVVLDGGDERHGEFVAVEVLNVSAIGANIALAAEARSDDGLLDVLLLDAGGRGRLRDYLTARLDGVDAPALHLPVHRARELRIRWEGSRIHVDDEIWPDEGAAVSGRYWPDGRGVEMDIRIERRALTFVVPR